MLDLRKCVLYALVVFATAAQYAKSDETAEVTKSTQAVDRTDLEKLPFLGVVESSSTQLTQIEIPDVFIRDEVLARIDFKNSFAAELKILGVKTSCGCTKVTYEHTAIPPSDSAVVVFGISPSKIGAYGVKVSVHTTFGDVPIQLSGRVRPKLLLDSEHVTLVDGDEFDVPINVYDKRLETSEIYFSLGSEKLYPAKDANGHSSIRIRLHNDKNMASRTLVPVIDGVALPPLTVSLRKPGTVELLTSDVLVANGYFDLVLRGHIELINNASPMMSQSGREFQLKSKLLQGGEALFIRCAAPNGIQSGEGIFKIGQFEFKRKVVVQ